MRQPNIRSKYNSKETFSFDETPGEFNSITEKSINDIKSYCTHIIANKYKGSYDSRTLYAMVRTVMGNFDLLTSRLNEDCASRRSKLRKAQNKGIKQVNELLIQFEKTASDYNNALTRYNDNVVDYDGRALGDDLHYQTERLNEFKNRLKRIEEKNYEA